MSARRFAAVVGLATLLAVATMPLFSFSALAATPRDTGWWTVSNPGGLPAQPPAPPDVPATGMLIQGGPNAPTAYAALIYELDPGTSAQSLTLAVAPNSVTTPSTTLQLCQLITPITHPEQGGPLSDGPAYNCSKKATAAASGNQYKFDVSGLMADNLLPVAILPTGPVDRVVFTAPDANSLATQQTTADTSSATSDLGASAVTSDSAPAADTGGLSSSPFVAAPSTDAGVAGSSFAPPAQGPAAVAAPGGPTTPFVPAASSTTEKATPILVIVLVLGALASVLLWFYAGRQRAGALLTR